MEKMLAHMMQLMFDGTLCWSVIKQSCLPDDWRTTQDKSLIFEKNQLDHPKGLHDAVDVEE
jgi:hypothetical protein